MFLSLSKRLKPTIVWSVHPVQCLLWLFCILLLCSAQLGYARTENQTGVISDNNTLGVPGQKGVPIVKVNGKTANSDKGKKNKSSKDVRTEEDGTVISVPALKSASIREDTVLTPGDVIAIRFDPRDRHNDLNGRYQVDTQGNLILPGVGLVQVAGIKLNNLASRFQQKIGERITVNFTPAVQLVKQLRYIQILQGVRYPGWYTVDKNASLKDIAALAGGMLHGVDPDQTIVIRHGTTFPLVSAVPFQSFDDLAIGGNTKKPITKVVDNGDLLYVVIPKEISAENQPTEKSYFKKKIEVDRHGYIFLPSQGNVYVAGMTPEQIAATITDNLPRYLSKNDSATVNLVEKRHFVQVLGQVNNPGWHNIAESANLQFAINSAGGLIDGAMTSKISVSRLINNRRITLNADLFHYITTGDGRMLPVIQENDVIFVPMASAFGAIKRSLGAWSPPDSRLHDDASFKIRIFGGVKSPGIYEPQKNMSILDLIIAAGGSSEDADLSNTLILREGHTTRYNLKQLIEKSAHLPLVQAGDVVQVGRLEKSGYKTKASRDKVRIFGAIRKAGGYVAVKKMTLLDLIITAGGTIDDADLSNVLILRKGKSIKVNLKRIIEKSKPVPGVRAGDIVQIGRMEKSGYKTKTSKDKARIFGAVKKSGGYPVKKDMTLLDLLTMAGGETPNADLSNVIILRKNGTVEKINMTAMFDKPNHADYDFPLIHAGDTVKISFLLTDTYREKSTKDKVRIFGAIAKSGSYQYTKNMNLLDLIIAANGETAQADLSNIRILRATGTTETCNLKEILNKTDAKKITFPSIYPGDVVHIGFLVHLNIKSKSSRKKVRIFGAVNRPAGYEVQEDMNLIDLITEAGGETLYADLTRIQIYRPNGNNELFDLKLFLAGGSQQGMPVFTGGEVVHIPHQRQEGVVYEQSVTVTGEGCDNNGVFPYQAPMTVMEAIARAGGLNDFAKKEDIMIIRRVAGKQENIPFDYDQGIRGAMPETNILLQPGDIVYVP